MRNICFLSDLFSGFFLQPISPDSKTKLIIRMLIAFGMFAVAFVTFLLIAVIYFYPVSMLFIN